MLSRGWLGGGGGAIGEREWRSEDERVESRVGLSGKGGGGCNISWCPE